MKTRARRRGALALFLLVAADVLALAGLIGAIVAAFWFGPALAAGPCAEIRVLQGMM